MMKEQGRKGTTRCRMVGKIAACVIVLLALKWLFTPSMRSPHPHIIFIVADDLGWNDVSWHNPLIKTPNLEKYARAGVILNASYVAPICSPSRASFMTGYYAHRTGLQHIPIVHFKEMYLPSRFTLLPELLRSKGYATHLVGKWHLGFCNWRYTPRYRGFDSFLGYYGGQEGYYNHTNGKVEEGYDLRVNEDVLPDPDMEYGMFKFNRRAEEVIAEHDLTKPLFLFISYQSVHSPLEASVPLLLLFIVSLSRQLDYHSLWRPLKFSPSHGGQKFFTEPCMLSDLMRPPLFPLRIWCRVGDYKLIKGEPGRFFDWFPLPAENDVPPTQYPTWKRRPWTPLMFPEFQLFNISADPEERQDIADKHPGIVRNLKEKLAAYEKLAVPSQHPPVEPKSLPHNFGGVWTPGWCP